MDESVTIESLQPVTAVGTPEESVVDNSGIKPSSVESISFGDAKKKVK